MFCRMTSYFQNRSNSSNSVDLRTAPISTASSSQPDPVIADTSSEISISVVPPSSDYMTRNFPAEADTRSIYQTAYNISRWSFHSPGSMPISRSISDSPIQPQMGNTPGYPHFGDDERPDRYAHIAGPAKDDPLEISLNPSMSEWRAHTQNWVGTFHDYLSLCILLILDKDAQSALYDTVSLIMCEIAF